MALKVGELFSELRVDTKGAERDLGQHQRALQQTAQQAGATETAVEGLGKVMVTVDKYARDAQGRFIATSKAIGDTGSNATSSGNALNRLSQYVRNAVTNATQLQSGATGAARAMETLDRESREATTGLGQANSMLKQVAASAAGFVVAQAGMRVVGAAVEFVKDSFFGMNSLVEQSSIAFSTMLGSSEAAATFLEDMADFAARTPFDFPGLLTAAQRMMAYGFAAEEVLPLLEDIGNASAALGTGTAGVDRMTLALGQMVAKGKVQTQELLQLTELGIPAFQILADEIGISVGELQDLVSAGEVSSDVFLKVFQEWSRANFGGMMAEQSRTWDGALSNMQDRLTMFIARGLEPFYDLLRDGAVRLAAFLDTTTFDRWEATLTALSQRVVDALLAIPGTASAFHAWINDIISSGNPLTAFLDTLPGWFQDAVDRIGQALNIGGYNAITAFADGMIESAQTNVQAAVDYVADIVASYLVGQSPPPSGPLSKIDEAGRNLMETYAEGMVEGAGAAEMAGESVLDAMKRIDDQAQLDAGRAGLEAATGNLEAMEYAADNVTGKIAEINREMASIDLELRDIDREIRAINDAYDATLEPLYEQLDLLERQKTLQEEKLQLEHDLARAKVQQAQLEALGDPERRAEIAGEMALLDIEKQRQDNAKRMAEIQAELEGGPLLTDDERVRLEMKQRQLALDRQETQNRLNTDRDLTNTERQRLQLRLEQIDLDIKANNDQLNGTKQLTEAERARLELQLEELRLRQELLEMIDAEASAQATADAALLDSRQKEKDLIEDIADIQNEIAKIPILEEIEKVNKAREEALKPLETERQSLLDQKQYLEDIRAEWQFIKGDIDAALSPMREAARLQEQQAKAAERSADAAEREAEAARKKLEAAQRDNSFEASQARLAGTGTPCAPGWIMDEFGRCFNPAEQAWRESIAEAEREKKKSDNPALQALEDWEKENLEIPVTFVADDNLREDLLPEPKAKAIGYSIGEDIVDGMLGRIGGFLKDNIGKTVGTAIGAGLGGLLGSAVGMTAPGAAIGGLIGGVIGRGLQEALEERGINLDTLTAGIKETFNQEIKPVITEIARFMRETVIPAITEFASVLQEHVWPVVQDVFGFLSEHKETIAAIVAGIATAVVVFKTLSAAVGGFLAAKAFLVGLPALLAPLLAALTPVVLVVSAIAAAVGLLVVAWIRNWGDIQGKTKAVWDWLRPNLEALGERINRFTTLILPELRAAWENIWAGIKIVASAIWTVVSTVFTAISGFISTHGDTIMRLVSFYWDYISTVVDTALGMISNVIQLVLNVIAGDWEGAWENIKEYFRIAWEGIQELLGLATTAVQTIIEEALPVIKEKLGEWASAFLDWVTDDVLPYVGDKIAEIGTRIWNWISGDGLTGMIDRIKGWSAAFLDWVSADVVPFLVAELTAISTRLLAWITDTALPEIKTALLAWAGAFLNFVKDDVLPYLWDKLGDILTSIQNWVADKLSDIKSSALDIGKSLLEGIAQGIYDFFDDTLGKALEWAGDKVPDVLKKLWGVESPAKAFMPIGGAAMQGLMVGIDNERDNLEQRLGELAGMIHGNLSLSTRNVDQTAVLPAAMGESGSLAGILREALRSQQRESTPGTINLNLRVLLGNREFRDVIIEELNAYGVDTYSS